MPIAYKTLYLGLIVMVVSLFVACGSANNEEGDITRPAAFKSLSAYDVLKGKVEIDVEASPGSRIELKAGDTSLGTRSAPPYSFAWDTSSAADGIVTLNLRQEGREGPSVADQVPIILLNKGLEAPYDQGVSSGELALPQAGVDSPHLSFTWIMPDEGIKEVLALLFWKDSTFKMEMSMGVGCCARTGSIGAKSHGAVAPVIVSFKDTKEMPLPLSTKWFVDISATNPLKAAGLQTDLSVKVYLLK